MMPGDDAHHANNHIHDSAVRPGGDSRHSVGPMTHESLRGDTSQYFGWRSALRRKWLLFAVAFVALAVIFWVVRSRDTTAPAVAEPESEATAARDTVIVLDSVAQKLSGVEIVTATTSANAPLVANGTITYDANHVSVIAPRVEGRIVSLRADLGQSVRAGSVVAILESSEVGQTRGALERARVAVDVARRNLDREKRLFEQQISPQKELLSAEAEFRSAEADFNSERASLRALGAADGAGATFGLISPIAGTVVERNASPGQVAGPSSTLFTIADLRHVWITVDIYEGDLRRVRDGATATVIPSALPDISFTGRVTYAGGVVDAASRTFKVRVELNNSELRLRPGMFAQVRIDAPPSADKSEGIVVPEIAVQEVGGKQVVFVVGELPGQFIARPVTLGTGGAGGMVVVVRGLRSGEQLVGKGAFQLKAEILKASFGDAH